MRFVRLLLIASVLYGTGAHWALLQGAAWTSMIATRVSQSSWAEAVSSTFSGQKPCRFCRIAEKGSAVDNGSMPLRAGPGLDLIFSVASGLNAALSARTPCVVASLTVRCLSSQPSVPPPKTVLPA